MLCGKINIKKYKEREKKIHRPVLLRSIDKKKKSLTKSKFNPLGYYKEKHHNQGELISKISAPHRRLR